MVKRFGLFLLRKVIRPEYAEDIEGDLLELYGEWKIKGSFIANVFLFIELIKLVRRPLLGGNSHSNLSNHRAMIYNYIKVSLRNLMKYKSSSLLNILGLGFGIACCALCYIHIQFELGFDQFHANKNRIYRLTAGNPADDFWVKVAAPIPPTLKSQIPEIEEFVRFNPASYNAKVLVESDGNTFLEPYFMMTDPSFFKVFNFATVEGDPLKGLKDLNSVVITATTAKKLFGNNSALGKVITLKGNGVDFQVAAVIEDSPVQSHIRFDYLVSFENLDRLFGAGSLNSWNQYNWYAYLLLDEHADAPFTQQKIQKAKVSLPDSREATFDGLFLQPLSDIHFQDNRGNLLPAYNKKYIYIFLTIAVSLLLIACINYINLSIALSIKRIKEIGVRKAVGASRGQLVYQFVNEGVVISFVSLMVGLLLLHGALPFVNLLLNSSMAINYSEIQFLSFLTAITLGSGLISGSYLAFYVNRYKASAILKGDLNRQGGGLALQRALIFVQFSISIVLIVCSLIISRQMSFLQARNLGFNHEQILTVPLSSGLSSENLTELKNQLRQSSSVIDVSTSSFVPGQANWHQTVWWEGQTEAESMFIISIDKDFLRAMQIELIEGDLKTIEASDDSQYILNAAALKSIGWDNGLGKMFSPFGESNKKGIAGVTQNFNFMSLHHQVAPLVLVVSNRFSLDQLFVRIAGGDLPGSIQNIESTYENVLGDLPFEYTFMDEKINQLYKSELQVKEIVSYLTVIAVLFALLGVYGLISFSIENKTKEIAIRKVLGVAPMDLVVLFSKRYYQLMIVAFLVAVPIVWKVMTSWLENFSYKVDVTPIWFIGSFAGVMIAITIIGFIKYISIQKINPANALKYE